MDGWMDGWIQRNYVSIEGWMGEGGFEVWV